MVAAQRRPERQPRLHPSSFQISAGGVRAQRRPERQPRLHTRVRLDLAEHVQPMRAQRRPERQPRLHTPSLSDPQRRRRALNEGRSVNPGYTRRMACGSAQRRPERQPRLHSKGIHMLPLPISAQRRPERQPRLHPSASATAHRTVPLRSTKAGASTPATLLNSAKGQYRDKPSLVHGCGSLDNDAFASISRDFGRYPVRMVRIKR